MSITDILFVLEWWGVLFAIGIVFLPITTSLFELLWDKGYVFAKIFGAALLSYSIFLLSTLHILSFSSGNSIAMLASWAVITYVFFPACRQAGHKKNILQCLRSFWKTALLEEILFGVGLFFWSYIRTFQPDIHGLEKYMDYGFVNSILRTSYFPPKDMWYTPFTINYYYFGHLVTAVLTRLSFIPSSISFNLMLATIFACCFVGAFSIGSNLVWQLAKHKIQTSIIPGILTAFLLTFAGNLHTLYLFFRPYQNENPVPLWQLAFSPFTFPNNYWYPNATRFIYHTIHEFPIYSFVVSDLHGHVLDIPFVLLTIAFLFVLFIKPLGTLKNEILTTLVLSFLVACMYMTNAWDGLIYIVAGIGIIFLRSFGLIFTGKSQLKNYFFLFVAILIGGFFIISLPFSIFFHPGSLVGGIGINCAPDFLIRLGHIGPILFEQGYCQHSPLWQLLTLYGFFYFWGIGLVVYLFTNKTKKLHASDMFALFLLVIATLLIILPEFIYMKDIYTTYFRANTMFKLVYQAFIMLSLVSAYSVIRIFRGIRSSNTFYAIPYTLLGIVLLILVFLYPYFAINSYYNNLQTKVSLNGTGYLNTLYPTDYAGIIWLNKNVYGQPVILEAQGDSYTDYARISSNTGLPTVIGWPVHEWLWRGSYSVAAPRIEDVQTLYETTDMVITKTLIKHYNIQYVFVGDLERKKYTSLDEEKFQQLGTVVFKDGETVIYKLKS